MLLNNKDKLNYYAKILIFVSITLMVYGFILDINNEKKLINPIDDVVSLSESKSTVSITTVDGSEVVPGNKITKTNDSIGSIDTPTNGGSKNNNKGDTPNNNISNNNVSKENNIQINTIDEANENLRNNLEATYNVDIKYGSDTIGYKVGGFTTVPLDNSTTINAALNRLKDVFSLYPVGFFNEIKKGGIPLTIILINNYSDNSITGITDSNNNYAKISIALEHPFEESFYHESYHYIERYIFKKGGNFNSWNILNPSNFKYGIIVNNYSYANTFSDSVPFVNNYAQTSDSEDRASTFEYMMADSKASCLNQGKIVWQKANLIKNTIEAVFNTVSPDIVEYWERFI